MSLPLRSLPVLQSWDCHGCGKCCREYEITLTVEERQRLLSQGWENDPVLGGAAPFVSAGPWWARRYRLNQRPDGTCVFLTDQGRCRIHEKFGADAKPLPCRLYPFVLAPGGDHWRVGLRFACPSAAASKGRPLAEHEAELRRLAAELERQEGDGRVKAPAPPLQPGQQAGWPDLLHFVQALLTLLRDRHHRVEHRLRLCLALARTCRQARFDKVTGPRLVEFLKVLTAGLEGEVPGVPVLIEPPTWVGRALFRQALAIHVRTDQGPERGEAVRGWHTRARAAWRFAVARGPVPRLHVALPETTFERVEGAVGPAPPAAEQVLERYYTTRVGALQFFGQAHFGVPFWEGLEALALTYPMIRWISRALAHLPPEEAVTRAVQMVDYHSSFNPLLGSGRYRLALRMLARRGELERLIAWYAR